MVGILYTYLIYLFIFGGSLVWSTYSANAKCMCLFLCQLMSSVIVSSNWHFDDAFLVLKHPLFLVTLSIRAVGSSPRPSIFPDLAVQWPDGPTNREVPCCSRPASPATTWWSHSSPPTVLCRWAWSPIAVFYVNKGIPFVEFGTFLRKPL